MLVVDGSIRCEVGTLFERWGVEENDSGVNLKSNGAV